MASFRNRHPKRSAWGVLCADPISLAPTRESVVGTEAAAAATDQQKPAAAANRSSQTNNTAIADPSSSVTEPAACADGNPRSLKASRRTGAAGFVFGSNDENTNSHAHAVTAAEGAKPASKKRGIAWTVMPSTPELAHSLNDAIYGDTDQGGNAASTAADRALYGTPAATGDECVEECRSELSAKLSALKGPGPSTAHEMIMAALTGGCCDARYGTASEAC